MDAGEVEGRMGGDESGPMGVGGAGDRFAVGNVGPNGFRTPVAVAAAKARSGESGKRELI